jgi:sugar-specific transcriptional regulator TrmB
MADVFSLFKAFGFNESDVKVYMAFNRYGECTGYEVSKLSGVPRSKVYTVLNKLLSRGLIVVSEEEKTNRYKAAPGNQVITLLKNSINDDLSLLGEELRQTEKPKPDERIWHLKNYNSIKTKCLEMITRGKKELLIQIWMEDLDERLEQAIIEQQEKLERVLVVLYDTEKQYNTRLKKYYRHGFEYDKLIEAGCRWLTIASDKTEMVYATILSKNTVEAVFTKNHNMVFFANEYVLHDAYCLRLIEKINTQVKDIFGEDMEGIREVFSLN